MSIIQQLITMKRSIETNQDLIREVLKAKAEVAILKKKRRLLIVEIHRQFLEGELEPKRRAKQLEEKIKGGKSAANTSQPASND